MGRANRYTSIRFLHVHLLTIDMQLPFIPPAKQHAEREAVGPSRQCNCRTVFQNIVKYDIHRFHFTIKLHVQVEFRFYAIPLCLCSDACTSGASNSNRNCKVTCGFSMDNIVIVADASTTNTGNISIGVPTRSPKGFRTCQLFVVVVLVVVEVRMVWDAREWILYFPQNFCSATPPTALGAGQAGGDTPHTR